MKIRRNEKIYICFENFPLPDRRGSGVRIFPLPWREGIKGGGFGLEIFFHPPPDLPRQGGGI
jgi:hypothetical protein